MAQGEQKNKKSRRIKRADDIFTDNSPAPQKSIEKKELSEAEPVKKADDVAYK